MDSSEVSMLVARLDSVRLLLFVATQEEWIAHHMDVKLAFLNGELEEEVFVVHPLALLLKGKRTRFTN